MAAPAHSLLSRHIFSDLNDMHIETQPSKKYGDDFLEIKNIKPQQVQLEALALFQAIGIKSPFVFGGSLRDRVHGAPFKDIDVTGCYTHIIKNGIHDIADEINRRLSTLANVTDVKTSIKFNHHTGGQRIVTECLYNGMKIDASLEEVQTTIPMIQARENVPLSAVYMHADGILIAHKSFVDAATKGEFKVISFESRKRFALAIGRYWSLSNRPAYRHLKFRIALPAVLRSLKHRKPEPFPGVGRVLFHIKRLALRPKHTKTRGASNDGPQQN